MEYCNTLEVYTNVKLIDINFKQGVNINNVRIRTNNKLKAATLTQIQDSFGSVSKLEVQKEGGKYRRKKETLTPERAHFVSALVGHDFSVWEFYKMCVCYLKWSSSLLVQLS